MKALFRLCFWIFALPVLATVNAPSQYTGIPTGGGVNCASGTNGQVYTTNGSTCSFTTVSGTGTVTSVGLATDSTSSNFIVNSSNVISGSPITGAGTMTISLSTQTKNTVHAGPTTGSAAAPTFRALVGADLPNPSATTLGGVQSITSASHQWINSISTSGVPAQSQPAFTDISGSVAASQLPNPSASSLGGVQSAASVSHEWINSISTSGVPALSQPAFTDISGSVASTQMPALTGDVTSSAGAVATTVAKIQGTTVSGVTGTTNVVMSVSPSISGSSVSIQKGNCYITNVESDIGNSGSAVSIDMSTANVFTVTLNSATPTITLSNYASNGCPTAFIFTQDGSGSRVPSFSGPTIIWGNSGTKTFSTAANAVDKVVCVYNGNISKLMCDLATAYQ